MAAMGSTKDLPLPRNGFFLFVFFARTYVPVVVIFLRQLRKPMLLKHKTKWQEQSLNVNIVKKCTMVKL